MKILPLQASGQICYGHVLSASCNVIPAFQGVCGAYELLVVCDIIPHHAITKYKVFVNSFKVSYAPVICGQSRR